ncbi:ferritin family protein [Fredinandcohnia humi]
MYQNRSYQGYYYPYESMRQQLVNRSTMNQGYVGAFQKVLDGIMRGIKGESQAIDFYKRLVEMAPDESSKEDVLHALADEEDHLRKFINLYIQLTGNQPVFRYEKKQFDSFEDGLLKAYNDELEAYEDYRNSYLLSNDQLIRDVFFHAMTDEIEHATRFGFHIGRLR